MNWQMYNFQSVLIRMRWETWNNLENKFDQQLWNERACAILLSGQTTPSVYRRLDFQEEEGLTKNFFKVWMACNRINAHSSSSFTHWLPISPRASFSLVRRFHQVRMVASNKASNYGLISAYQSLPNVIYGPKSVLFYGGLGLLPFISIPIYLSVTGKFFPELLHANTTYGAGILTYLGAVR